jgi:hypothetical protein
LLLAYKVPREPSANRVYVWRKLRKLAAVAIQDAVWVLPKLPQTLEHFRWLAAEIAEMKGEASLWESNLLINGQDQGLVRQFAEQTEPSYRTILSALARKKPDLDALSRQYVQTLACDYFRGTLSKQVRNALIAAKGKASR